MLEWDKDFIDKLWDRLLSGLKNQALMNRLGLGVRRLIQDRTRKGLDVQGKPFRKYSGGHAKRRAKLGLPTHPVNLQMDDVSGMLRRIEHVVARDLSDVEVYIGDPVKERIAYYHNVSGAGKSRIRREFWGLAKKEESMLQDIVNAELKNVLRRL